VHEGKAADFRADAALRRQWLGAKA
jgi:hypothetical protein